MCDSSFIFLLCNTGYPDHLQTLGLGKRHPKAWWTELGHVMVEEGLLATQVARASAGFSYQRFMVGAAGKLHLQRHRAIPTSCLMNLQAARDSVSRDDIGATLAVMPTSVYLEVPKAFRIQLQFSAPFSTSVTSIATPVAVRSMSSVGLRQRKTVTSNALADYKAVILNENNRVRELKTMLTSDNHRNSSEGNHTTEDSLYDGETLGQLESRLRKTRGSLGEAFKLRPYKYVSSIQIQSVLALMNA